LCSQTTMITATQGPPPYDARSNEKPGKTKKHPTYYIEEGNLVIQVSTPA
jgi:hypothetical protein